MMISDLPVDLLEEILSRVPATSLKRLQSTCKRWNALFKDQRFTAKHFRNASKESILLMLNQYRVFPMTINLNVTLPSIEFEGPLSLIKDSRLAPEQVDIYAVFHCDGLLLCCTTKNNRPLLWNPCLGETRWIESKTGYNWLSKFALGYDEHKSDRSYKILMWKDHCNRLHDRVHKLEIYELSSDSWRVLDDVSMKDSILPNTGVCLKGNTYWLPYDKKNNSKVLLSFDFTLEKFKRLGLPQDDNYKMALSLVGDKKLSMLSVNTYTSKLDLWITNEIDTDVEAGLKWSKFFSLTIPNFRHYPRVLTSYLLDEEKKVAVFCNGFSWDNIMRCYIIGEENTIYREIPYAESINHCLPLLPAIINYIPSLVHVNICKLN